MKLTKSFVSLGMMFFSLIANAQTPRVSCAVVPGGYALVRAIHPEIIGNAVFKVAAECADSALLANALEQNIVCAPYLIAASSTLGYSAYRISDGQDLGASIFREFSDCEQAVSQTRNGMTCLIYQSYPNRYYSPYSVETGQDLGQTKYNSILNCQDSY